LFNIPDMCVSLKRKSGSLLNMQANKKRGPPKRTPQN
jgi:hypothetical protein